MRRQTMTLLVSAGLAIVLGVIGWGLPVPYVRLAPGPVGNTLGDVGGKPVITITGHQTVPTTGRLYLVTVNEFGGAEQDLSLGYVLQGWWDSSDAVVPTRLLYPPSTTAKQEQQQGRIDMDTSQESAKIAALRYLGYPLPPDGAEVVSLQSAAAKSALQLGDVITGVDSTDVTDNQTLLDALKGHHAGDNVVLHVQRDGAPLDAPITLGPPAPNGTVPTIGIQVLDSFKLPFTIDIHVGNVGGPSAGMAFALGIIDKLSTDDLTGGQTIAGTGEIEPTGKIEPIGGVQQKMVGARDAGATVFLLPKSNCADAVNAVPKGLRLVPVTTLSGAVDALKTLAAGKVKGVAADSNVPSCPAS